MPVPAIPNPAAYCVREPERAAPKRPPSATTALRINSHVPVDRPELAFVYGSAQAAMATLDRVATVATYNGTRRPIPNTGFAQALQAVAGAMVEAIGTRVFYVTTGGFDTHSAQNVNAANGTYFNLMATLNDGLFAFYNDLENQGLLEDTLVLTLLGVRPPHQRERQPGHRSRRRVGDDGDGRPRQRRPLRHRAEPQPRSARTRRSRTTPATSASRPTSGRSTRRCIDSWLGADSARDPRRRLPQGRPRLRLDR